MNHYSENGGSGAKGSLFKVIAAKLMINHASACTKRPI
jgi:hypothetical protein